MRFDRGWKLGVVIGATIVASICPSEANITCAYSGKGVHPGFAITPIDALGKVSTMGLGFLSNGDMVWVRAPNGYQSPPAPNANAGVWIVSDIASNPTVKKIADQFRQPTGVAVGPNDEIMVVDLDGVYKVTNLNPSATGTNKTRIVAAPVTDPSPPYHSYIFCPMYYNGMYYAPYSGTFVPGGFADSDPSSEYSTSLLAWKPDGSGGFTKYAGGLRSPNGGGLGPDGIMMFTDNQGSWNPSCALNIIKANKFYGTHQNPGFKDNWAGVANKNGTLPYQPPVAWLPQAIAVGAAYGISASTAQPLYMDHGPYQGDWIMGDCTLEGMSRVSLDPVNGGKGAAADYNGSVQWFTSGLNSGSNVVAPNRLVMDPKADVVYVGSLGHIGATSGAWPPDNQPEPFYKIALDAAAIKSVFEIRSVHSRANGIEVVFSQPVSQASAVAGSFAFKQWDLKRQSGYGAGNNSVTPPAIGGVEVSDDGTRVFLKIGNHAAPDRVLSIVAAGIRSQAKNEALVFNQAWFTHNYQSTEAFDPKPTGIAGRISDKYMDAHVSQALIPGGVKLRVDLKGAYTVALSSFSGARLLEKAGTGPGEIRLAAPGRGLYILQVRQGKRAYVRPVTVE